MTQPLIPPDFKQCQAEKPNGNTFMTLGGVPGYKRCTQRPVFLATEKEPGDDGVIGNMTLCAECYVQLERQIPGHVFVETLKEQP